MSEPADIARGVLHGFLVATGATGSTLALFLVLPLMKTIAKPPETDLVVQSIDTAELEPPPPPPEEEQEEEEPEEQDEPLELAEEAPPLDLSQLELALGDSFGEGVLGADVIAKLTTVGPAARSQDVDELFSISELDQEPRIVYQPSPVLDASARKATPGSVTVLFVVDQRGRVENPVVQKSTDPALERAALNAVKQWKFEPGKRNGEAVRFRMRVPITFPKG